MTNTRIHPPRLAERLMQQVLKSDVQQHGLVGDSREEYARRTETSKCLACDV